MCIHTRIFLTYTTGRTTNIPTPRTNKTYKYTLYSFIIRVSVHASCVCIVRGGFSMVLFIYLIC